MSKHTPGPWEVWCGGINVRTEKSHIFIAACGGCNDPSRSMEEYQANARLIASAPELLAAAKTVLPLLKSGLPCMERKQLRDAIAKAEGKE